LAQKNVFIFVHRGGQKKLYDDKSIHYNKKICAPFPRESAEKKAYADIRRKNPQIN
jgi:hypothetical protein